MKENQKTKRLIVGDIHGRIYTFSTIYKKELPEDTTKFDVILLGDYLDTHEDITPEEQVDGLKTLLEMKKTHEKKYGLFTMLMGNHDFHYFIDDVHEHYSGYTIKTAVMSENILRKAVKDHDIKFALVDNKNRTIYSHAGVTNTWINERQDVPIPINMIDLANTDSFKFTFGSYLDPYGDDPLNGPLWVRPRSLLDDLYRDFDNDLGTTSTWTQIVGHTVCKRPIITHEDGSEWKTKEDWRMAKFWDIDCLHTGYYMVEWLDEDGIVVDRAIKEI